LAKKIYSTDTILLISLIVLYSTLNDFFFQVPIITVNGLSFDDHLLQPMNFLIDHLIWINRRLDRSELLLTQMTFGRCIVRLGMWVRNLKLVATLEYNLIHLPSFQKLSGKSHFVISDKFQQLQKLIESNFASQELATFLSRDSSTIQKGVWSGVSYRYPFESHFREIVVSDRS
jgi:hypothetical protein